MKLVRAWRNDVPEEGTLDRSKLPSAEGIVEHLPYPPTDDELADAFRAYANAVLEAVAEYFERFPGAFTGRMIAADLRKLKETP